MYECVLLEHSILKCGFFFLIDKKYFKNTICYWPHYRVAKDSLLLKVEGVVRVRGV